MNGLVPISSSTLPALVAVAGERASMRFLEFFAANICNPHTRRAYYRAAEEFLLRERRRTLDRRRPAGARRHLDRGGDTRTGRTLGQTTARRPTSPVRLAGQRPGRAGQPGIHSARASACRDCRDK